MAEMRTQFALPATLDSSVDAEALAHRIRAWGQARPEQAWNLHVSLNPNRSMAAIAIIDIDRDRTEISEKLVNVYLDLVEAFSELSTIEGADMRLTPVTQPDSWSRERVERDGEWPLVTTSNK